MYKVKKSGIYGIFNNTNNKVYVGSSIHLETRKQEHFKSLQNGKHFSKRVQRSVDKHGIHNFEFVVLEECPSDILLARERLWIRYYDSLNPKYGYNNIDPIERFNGYKISEEHRKNLSLSHKGPLSDIQYEAVRKGNQGKNKGHKQSAEHLAKLSAIRKNRKLSEEWKENIRKGLLANPSFKGHKHTEASKELIRLANKKRIGMKYKPRNPTICVSNRVVNS